MSEEDELISAGDPIFWIVSVTPLQGRNIQVEWENGRIAQIDLMDRVTHRAFENVLSTDDLFKAVALEEYGWARWWPEAVGAAIPSSLLYAWADGKESEFE